MTDRKKVGTITEKERDEIQLLNYRKQTLTTLFRSLADEENDFNPHLYDKMVDDMTKTEQRYDAWFRDKAKQYGWESGDGMSWSVDFDACEVFLVG